MYYIFQTPAYTKVRSTNKVELGQMAVIMSASVLMPVEDSTSVLRGNKQTAVLLKFP